MSSKPHSGPREVQTGQRNDGFASELKAHNRSSWPIMTRSHARVLRRLGGGDAVVAMAAGCIDA
jgi:hypothetical protein